MKKLILFLFLSIVINCVNAQNRYVKHMTFLDIEINGSKEDFGKKLVKKGFTKYNVDGKLAYSGTFIARKCIIIPVGNGVDIEGVKCLFEEEYSVWKDFCLEYNEIFNLYKEKYGEANLLTDIEFESPYSNDSYDDSKALALKNGNVKFNGGWKMKKGVIMITNMNNRVLVSYYDYENCERSKELKLDEI